MPRSCLAQAHRRHSLYYRLDLHWSRPGALLASEVVKSALERLPPCMQALQDSPEAAYTLVEKKMPKPSQGRDLISLLPAGASAPYPPEAYPPILVQKPASKGAASLTGDSPMPRIALVGSRYSQDWTGFADFLRYQFQRHILHNAVPANQGSWVGMMRLLRDGAFQKSPPRLILWEWPERDMHAPPNFQFREERYRFPTADWLLAAAAAVQKTCPASPAKVGAAAAGSPIAVSGATAGMDFPGGEGGLRERRLRRRNHQSGGQATLCRSARCGRRAAPAVDGERPGRRERCGPEVGRDPRLPASA